MASKRQRTAARPARATRADAQDLAGLDKCQVLGLGASRTLEAAVMFAGVASLWTIVSLRQAGAGQDGARIGRTLVAFYDRAFLVGQSLIPAINALFLGTLLYQSRLVPRIAARTTP